MGKASVSSFDAARIEALKRYAILERELCFLTGRALKVDDAVAHTIFYNISATRARYSIIGSALKLHFADTFARSWPKIESWLRPRDTARNHIIHWGQDETVAFLAQHAIEGGGSEVLFKRTENEELINLRNRGLEPTGSELTYTEDTIRDETAALNRMRIIILRYHACISRPEQWPWTEKFRLPVTDQTPTEFLHRLNSAEPEAPPQSSEG